tara:strand:+ start:551 stop:703 length:153 start_codon:yes stop_codon:yes gene_type:complete
MGKRNFIKAKGGRIMKHILDALASLGLVVLPLGATIIVWVLIAREIIRIM